MKVIRSKIYESIWRPMIDDYYNYIPLDVRIEINSNIYHLGLTQSGQPRHPLYIGYDTDIIKYEERQ